MPAHLPEPGDPRVIYVLDLSGFVFRAYHALPPLSNKKGEPTHAIHGVVSMIQKILAERRPPFFAVAVDPKRDTSFRRAIYAEYKATRKDTPIDLVPQAQRVREIAEAYGLPVLEAETFEADDIIATVVRFAKAHGLRVVIASADKDLLQLVGDPDVVMYDSMREKVFGPDETVEKLGIGPAQVRDYLALVGDTSDNVPGVPSVGPKTAVQLLTEHGSLDGVYAALGSIAKKGLKDKLTAHRDDAYLSQRLVRLREDVPLPALEAHGAEAAEALRVREPDLAKLGALFTELELYRAQAELDRSRPGAREARQKALPTATFKEPSVEILTAAGALHAFVSAIPEGAVLGLRAVTEDLDLHRTVLVGVALGTAGDKPRSAYVPVGHVYLGRPPSMRPEEAAHLVAELVPMLRARGVTIAFHDAKDDLLALAREGAEIAIAPTDFDSMLASYLLHADSHAHALGDVAEALLSVTLPALATPEKRSQRVRLSERTVEEVARVAAPGASAIAQLVIPLRTHLASESLDGVLRELELPLLDVLVRLERTGVAIDVAKLATMASALEARLVTLEKRCHEAAGHPFQVGSPRALETVLFDELGLPVKKRTKTARSTDADVLEELAELHELPSAILELRAAQKLKSTYVDALPRQIDPSDRRVHTRFNQAVAATGRLSSSDPNLQNIPIRTDEGRAIREAFVAPPGHSILSADYSQIELRVLAHLSEDPELSSAFIENVDVHVKTASAIFGVPEAAVTREQRGRAKTVNFAVIYGQAERALARNLGIEEAEAKRYIAAFFSRYAGVARYLDDLVTEARRTGSVRTMMGRRREVPDIHARNWSQRFAAERIARNTPIQGTAADILKVAMIRIDQRLREARMASRMILTVHDELVFEVPHTEVTEARVLVRRTMEDAAELRVPLLVEDGVGPTWGSAH
ncbi:MAG: DNA polymerase I [Sandaracinaceae bacterium]|nr:DNA polymerase I [Sandaracinaceae bacterium]